MKNLKPVLAAIALSFTIVACNNSTQNNSAASDEATETQEIVVNAIDHAKEFPGATLNIASLTAEPVGTDSARVTVKYDIQNFNLTEQTEHEHHMANSHDGQHIHFILNNTPYVALYEPEYSVTVPVSSEHYLLSFLSRSFHESIKTEDAAKLIKFKVTADAKIEELPKPTEPSLFYSRPKGDYKGDDAEVLLLDFFVANTTLAADGNKVQAVINGQEFTLDQWRPYEILNLPEGETTIKLTLVDNEGKAIAGDNVSIESKIKLSEQ